MSIKRLAAVLWGLTLFGPAAAAGEVRGEPMTCLGACRVDYGSCLMEAKNLEPTAADARRAECGHAYLRCSVKCKASAP